MKHIILGMIAILAINGCANQTPSIPQTTKVHTFGGGKQLIATAEVSTLVKEIEALKPYNNLAIDLDSNQNVKIGKSLKISLKPKQSGYLKLVAINPEGKKSLLMPNDLHNGYLKANQKFSTTNNKFSLKAFSPKGLHYIVAVFTQKNFHLDLKQNFLEQLHQIKEGNYLNHAISIYPMRVY